jgi:p-aminobenzoyl-glutamate transporter AbgT
MLLNYSLIIIVVLILVIIIGFVVNKPYKLIQKRYKKYNQRQKMDEPKYVLGGFSEPNHTYSMFTTFYTEPSGPPFSRNYT